MADSTTTKSWGSSVTIGIVILVLAIALIVIIFLVFLRTTINPYPVSSFKFGDTIQISPAVFSRNSFSDTGPSENQYLIKNTCPSQPCDNCYIPTGANGCVATFSGSKSDPNTKWVLEQLPYTGIIKQSTQQNVLATGNRFYLRSATNAPNEISGRLTFNLFDSTLSCEGLSPDRAFPVSPPSLGSSCYDPDTNFNEGNELVFYFWPTTQPDLYYILFPGSLNTETRTGSPTITNQLNNGVATLRPYAPAPKDTTTYSPYQTNVNLFNNGLLLNGQNNYPVGAKYPTPEVFLFRVTKV